MVYWKKFFNIFMLKLIWHPSVSILVLNKSKHFFSCQIHRKCTGAHKLQNNTHSALSVFPSPHPNTFTSLSNTNSVVVVLTQNQHLSTLIMFPLSFFLYILSSRSVTFPVALSSYLRQTAPVQASLTNWGPQVSQPSPPSPRRSAPFLPRGSAPSAHAHTVWPTATRSETWSLWEAKITIALNGRDAYAS